LIMWFSYTANTITFAYNTVTYIFYPMNYLWVRQISNEVVNLMLYFWCTCSKFADKTSIYMLIISPLDCLYFAPNLFINIPAFFINCVLSFSESLGNFASVLTSVSLRDLYYFFTVCLPTALSSGVWIHHG
jgi:hypothetical protein